MYEKKLEVWVGRGKFCVHFFDGREGSVKRIEPTPDNILSEIRVGLGVPALPTAAETHKELYQAWKMRGEWMSEQASLLADAERMRDMWRQAYSQVEETTKFLWDQIEALTCD